MASEAVKVIVRCRPLNEREKQLGCKVVVNMDSSCGQCFIQNPMASEDPPKQFTFDGAYNMSHNTEQIYNEIAYPLIEGVTEGYNGTIFAYGQTGSGKSFTMQGILDPSSQKGIIPRAFEHLFESVQLKEHPEKGVYVKGLSLHTVHSIAQCERIMEMGWKNRAVGYTLMNKDSSRSHSIFTINMEIYVVDERGQDHLRAAKLNLVDLAGSERQSKTGAVGERLKEATKINLSLSALGNVISALADGRCRHVPYRDSKLTRVLQDSLGGNTKTLMVACLSPADNNYDETLSTLRYAHRAKNIRNKPRINEDPKDALLREYQEEIKKLRAILAQQMNMSQLQVELSHMLPPEAAQPEAKPEPSLESLADIEKEKQLIREEYEERLARLKADYEAEQESRVRLEEDISALRSAYDMKFHTLDENLQKEAETTQTVEAIADQDSLPPGLAKETEVSAKECNSTEPPVPSVAQNMEKAVRPGTPGTDVAEELPVAVNQQQVLARLQMLEQQVVGGEQAKNKDLKEKHKRRKKIADERKKQLLAALQKSDEDSSDWVLLNVYDSIQEEVRAKSKLLEKMKEKLRVAETEIKDLQSEFEMEKIDYLATIRRQERELLLYQQLLDQVQPLIRRDCNYSNFDKIKRESTWDEESGCWKIPEPVTQKTSLPAAVSSLSQTKAGRKSSSSENGDAATMQEEDRYKVMLSKSDSENIASNYFRSKRASQILSADPMKSLASHNSPPLLNNNTSILTSSLAPIPPAQTVEMPQPRPFRLESLDFSSPSAKTKRKKSRNNLSSGDPL
ncbi:kinesin-like protein KIF17 isoform X5 [Lacerta agilis]|uniref:kinesin-like protein KIF17 isoform X5 n=1 Tax=Lacerta agilis TaxID=80427 RepID=UPI00141A021F|nr:kinesin-like protein KIF17 isoform X5 [Lacerta agilis]